MGIKWISSIAVVFVLSPTQARISQISLSGDSVREGTIRDS